MGYKVAVVGATGAVGNEMLQILAERQFPVDEIVALASEKSTGREVSFGDDITLKVQDLDRFDFEGFDIGLFSPGAKVSAKYAPKAAAKGCVVIDNTSHFRMDPDVPLVVPEVNREALRDFRTRNIIANPNCSTIQMVVALKPLHDIARIKRVVVATYQSVSGAGREAMEAIIALEDRPTAIVCFNDLVAIGALNAARANGLRVPEDVSITGWDDLPIAAWDLVRLTTVGQSMDEMARTAARLLVERIEGRAGAEARRVLFEPRIVMRETLGPPAGAG